MVEVVSAWPDVINRAFRGVIDGVVVLLAKLCDLMNRILQEKKVGTYKKCIDELLRWNNLHLRKSIG